ncbi:glycosyltransferase family 4 protein [Dyadobacter sp. Leaf189]|uniref:glycosyltransferase family 4 protein n=1 Tax=Dyadobacter sp. Leaf189 TaxID=1736295 RepID=UPI0009EBDF4C|nr:glycosyltransferase family 4 protein [Dyadobacter sp. Leaf189]
MKILILSHQFYPEVGGIEVNSEVLCDAFHNSGHQVRLLTRTKEKGSRTFPFKVIRNPGKYSLVREHLWADIVFENNLCLRLSWPRLFINRPGVVAIRTWISRVDGRMGWQDRLKFEWLKHASAVIAVSSAIKNSCWDKAVVIGNPYRSTLFQIQTEQGSRELDFVFMGRLVSDKGVHLAIKALRKFINQKKEVSADFQTSLTIIGDGPEAEDLKMLVRELQLEHMVFFTGVLRGKELVRRLNEHRFLLVPSVWNEPFGNVALEGMACGLIPIVSSGGGLPDAVGDAGLVFKSGNIDSLVEHMTSIYEDPLRQYSMHMNARNHLTNHHPEVVADRYLEVLQTAVRS